MISHYLIVVDPEVGSNRKILLAEVAAHRFVAPDNGVLSQVFEGEAHPKVWTVNTRCFSLELVSQTFHGRDIFAPVAAQLANGLDISSVGEQVDVLTMLNLPTISVCQQSIEGFVIFVDHFGNLVTNLTRDFVNGKRITLDILGESIHGINSNYQSGHELLLIIGSHGYLEIALSNGSAASTLGAEIGTEVLVKLSDRSFSL